MVYVELEVPFKTNVIDFRIVKSHANEHSNYVIINRNYKLKLLSGEAIVEVAKTKPVGKSDGDDCEFGRPGQQQHRWRRADPVVEQGMDSAGGVLVASS